MTSKFTREELLNIIETDHVQCGEASALARMALAAMDSEPVGEVIEVGDALLVEWHKNLEEGAKLYTTPQAPVIPFGLHLDTQKLVTDFCTALAEKLYKAQLKYGYDADWKQDGWPSQCQAHFHQHIAKGDPRDVAAYCAFMWYHGWKTEAAQPAPVVPAGKTMPNPLSMYAVDAVAAIAEVKGWNACRATMPQENPKSAGASNNCRSNENVQVLQAANSPAHSGPRPEQIIGSPAQDGNSPVIPDGYVIVPKEPTEDMIAAAMNCDDVLFNSDESFCVQFGNIYEAMLAAAPQEVK